MNRFSNTLLLAIVFLSYIGIGLVYPIFSTLFFDSATPFFSFHISAGYRGLWLGILLALMPLTQLFVSPLLGILSDKSGRKKIISFSLVVAISGYAISIIALYYASLFLLMASRIIIGIGAGAACVAQAALYDKSKDAKVFGLYNMMLGAGFTIGPYLGGKFGDPSSFSITIPFWGVMSLFFLLWFLVLLFYREPEEKVEQIGIVKFSQCLDILAIPKLRSLLVCAFIFTFGWAYFLEFVPVYLIGQHSFKSSMIGNFYAFSGAFYALSCGIFIRPLLRTIPLPTLLFTSLIASGSYALLFISIENHLWIWIYAPFLLFLVALIFPVISALLAKQAQEGSIGRVLGVLQSTQSLAFALSPLLSGAFLGLHIGMPIFMGGGSMLLAALVFGLSRFKE